jgi:ABC-type Fe3+-hydroxamate transport system substrate-binding protein
MRIFNELLNRELELPDAPQRIVSLTPFATETLAAWGCQERVVGVSAYCHPFMVGWDRPVVGSYLGANRERLRELEPDLILTSSGVQRPLALALQGEGWPVYTFPLPNSLWGILENVDTLAMLVGAVREGRAFLREWFAGLRELHRTAPVQRPRVYVELWLGSDMRTIGGLNYVHSLFDWVGAENVFGEEPRSYFIPDLEEVLPRQPDLFFFHTEPHHPVDVPALLRERGWDVPPDRLIQTSVDRGRNLIHDGPSLLESAQWLQARLREAEGGS